MSSPPAHPGKSDPPTPLPHQSERLPSRSSRGTERPDGGDVPAPPLMAALAPAPEAEPQLTLDEALRLHHLARYGGGGLDVPHRLPELVLSGGRSMMASVDAATTSTAARHSPTAAGEGTSAAHILEEAQRIVEEVDASIRLSDEPSPRLRLRHPHRAGGGPRRRSSSSHRSSPSPSDSILPRQRSSRSPPRPPEPDRQ